MHDYPIPRLLPRGWRVLMAGLLASSSLLLASPEPASAAVTRPLLLPFPPGQTWCIYLGYQSGTHVAFELDLVHSDTCAPDTTKDDPVTSPWSGVVYGKWDEGVCINLDGGGSFAMGHIAVDRAVDAKGDRVAAGQVLGKVRPAWYGANQTAVEHAHIAVWDVMDCAPLPNNWDYSKTTPFSGTTRMQCAPDLFAGASGENGQWGSRDPAKHPLTLLTRPTDAVARANTPFRDICNSAFRAEIGWAYAAKVSNGCLDGTMYCPQSTVTRDQMASFLARAYNLPAATRDYFWDDSGNFHEADINRIARANITLGCAAFTATTKGQYCPSSVVSRAEMVVFIMRAEGRYGARWDYFDDDNGQWFETYLNTAVEMGVFKGCGTRLACPNSPVLREQVAAMLYRAIAQ